jgi:predicted RNase H-like HicB family nuclease
MKDLIFIVEEDPSGSFSAHAKGHAIFTQAESIELLRDMIREAVELHFDDEPDELPDNLILHFVREEHLRLRESA